MIACPSCGKENQDHYKFCLGCGTKLPAPQPTQRPAASVAPGAILPPPPTSGATGTSHPAVGPGVATPIPGNVVAVGAALVCNNCGSANPSGFTFCGRCGNRLPVGAPVPAAPAPSIDVSARTMFVDPAQVPTGPAANRPGPAQQSARLTMLGPDGNPMGERLLEGETLEIGRSSGPPWDDDAYLDPRHASLTPTSTGVAIHDFDSLNGIFLKLEGRTDLRHADQFRVGQELLLYEELPEPALTEDGTERLGSPNPGYWGRLSVLVDPASASLAHPIEGQGLTIGRENGEMRFPDDGYVSGRHCRVFGDDGGVYLEDLGSSNGTYVRVRSGQTVPFGGLILIGQRLFRIDRP